MQQLEAHEVPLHRIFCQDYDFRIPDYQRPYAWGKEQAGQLLDDLVEALERNSDEPYFLGSVVLVKQKGQAPAEVIDGQQRLTTLTILLAVLRDLTGDPGLRTALDTMIVEPGNAILKLAPKPRMSLRKRDAAFFEKHVQTTGEIPDLLTMKRDVFKTDAQVAIGANAQLLHERLSTWSEETRLRLLQMLSSQTFLVVVSTPDLHSAHRIFSVMNARGLDLSPADIFKSKIIGAMDESVAEDYASRWEDAEQALGRDDFAELFQHIRMIFVRKRAERELLKEFPEQVLDSYLPANAVGFVDDVLEPFAAAFAQIRDQGYSSHAGAAAVNAWFRRLAQLDNYDWRPPALWALRHHGDDPTWLDQFFRSLERLAASMLVRRVYATPRAQRYASLLRDLADGHDLAAPSFELSGEERQETVARLDGDLYSVGKACRYVLLRLDEIIGQAPGVTYDQPRITIEHVLPQRPKEDAEWRALFGEDELLHWTNRLGNLVLLNRTKNSQAQNYDFAKKKNLYFKSKGGVPTFALTVQVLVEDEWTPAVVQKRQADLLEALRAEWTL
ncbi:DUF262 domain-containing HNH endonuclease family protein [Micromonospora sp. RTGN7]|uniref:DUF262 domain-containing protein n=1 Tax=Micromonospora sp. RTGN7 TaxID=3016526 RepID=UPI0029FECBB7|nr:DUF262 domain-containing HNH endonuclease family protein [Micromonospora sp. RTGN7]